MFGLAITCFIGRICIRVYTRRRLFLDDFVLSVAVAALIFATVTALRHSFYMYLVSMMFLAPELIATTPFFSYLDVLESSPINFGYADRIAVAQWTAIYGVKFCFFAFFGPLIVRPLRYLKIYYWACLAFTVGCYAVSLYEIFYFHKFDKMYRALPLGATAQPDQIAEDIYVPLVGFTTALCILDIFSDLMSKLIHKPTFYCNNNLLTLGHQ